MIVYNILNVDLDIDKSKLSSWLEAVVREEGFSIGELNYIFCTDDYLHDLNVKYLQHDTLTDVIGFDNSVGKKLHGDIFISAERVADNAREFGIEMKEELHRVMVHGLLHFCGYSDKDERKKELMTEREDYHLRARAGFF